MALSLVGRGVIHDRAKMKKPKAVVKKHNRADFFPSNINPCPTRNQMGGCIVHPEKTHPW